MKTSENKYWRSPEQLTDSPEFRRLLDQEFPEEQSEQAGALSRRRFMGLMSASLAMAGLAGCRRPVEKIIPYVVQPEEIVPGVAQFFATNMPFGSGAYGLVVESHEGRPTKIEGNQLHPASLGKSNVWMQAEILNLYDPDRSRRVIRKGIESSWDDFVAFWRERYDQYKENKGEGLAVLTQQFSSPTLARLRDRFLQDFPRARFVAYDPINDENSLNALTRVADGNDLLRPDYRFDKAGVILSLDSDFLLTENENVIASKRFAAGRKVTDSNSTMNRLYVVEADYSTTGASADHRLRVKRSRIGYFALALYAELVNQGLDSNIRFTAGKIDSIKFDNKWLKTVASDLIANRGRSLIVGGRSLDTSTHELILAINEALGNIGETIVFHPIKNSALSDTKTLQSLTDEMNDGRINDLIILGGNPVYDAPADLKFAKALNKVENSIHLSSHLNETSENSIWHLPQAHFLEYWGDTRAFDGTTGIIQPLIQPLFGGHSEYEFLELLVSGRDRRGYDIVRETWQKIISGDFEKNWRKVLHDGVYTDERLKPVRKKFNLQSLDLPSTPPPPVDDLELIFQPSPTLYDGRYANNGWLQELPHPGTKLTWDNAACVSPVTAEKYGLAKGDVVELSSEGKSIELPIWIVPGLAESTVSVNLGYGRTAAGRIGNGVGVKADKIRSLDNNWLVSGIKLNKTGRTAKLASTQDHGSMEGRPIVREATLEEFHRHPEFAREMVEHPPLVGMYAEHDYSKGYQWGMTIDLNACTGCNACTIACQSENNIPVVGKERVSEGREMHWIRLDRYFNGDDKNPRMVFQPVACQHCENAPCETVCPVQATSHDEEGLNVMTYNRCIGTRYCSNNCPYKVRRFNFFNYTKDIPEIVKMAQNPDVTVRSRGVMEKCTFCTQRINRARIASKREGRQLKDGEVVSACQQACPAEAITFGNINDPESKVTKSRQSERGYELLAEINTKPRNTYLAALSNPHPDLINHQPENI